MLSTYTRPENHLACNLVGLSSILGHAKNSLYLRPAPTYKWLLSNNASIQIHKFTCCPLVPGPRSISHAVLSGFCQFQSMQGVRYTCWHLDTDPMQINSRNAVTCRISSQIQTASMPCQLNGSIQPYLLLTTDCLGSLPCQLAQLAFFTPCIASICRVNPTQRYHIRANRCQKWGPQPKPVLPSPESRSIMQIDSYHHAFLIIPDPSPGFEDVRLLHMNSLQSLSCRLASYSQPNSVVPFPTRNRVSDSEGPRFRAQQWQPSAGSRVKEIRYLGC